MMALDTLLSEKLEKRHRDGLLRKLTIQRNLIDFSSNDYLGLSRSDELYSRIRNKCDSLLGRRNGATGSRLLTGNDPYAREVEERLAAIFAAEATIIFNSGFNANLAVLSALPGKDDAIFYDELAHASIRDGARLSLARRYSFGHNNLEDLEKKLSRSKSRKSFIAVESVYSMDGDTCPLNDLVNVAEKYGAIVILDEAHSTGAFGQRGSGIACALGLQERVGVRVYTFGKAMGVHGACVAGSQKLIDYLLNFARPLIYSTALPQHSLASIDCSFDYLQENMQLQASLTRNILAFSSQAKYSNRIKSESAIQTVIIPGNGLVREMAAALQAEGYDVRPILSPTVPKGKERLRICIHAFNTEPELVGLTDKLNKFGAAKP